MHAKQLVSFSIIAVALATGTAVQAQTVTRADVNASVLQARAHGELIPAGEAISPYVAPSRRAEVRESVREARLHGELIPAGEGMGPTESQARAHMARGTFAAYMRR